MKTSINLLLLYLLCFSCHKQNDLNIASLNKKVAVSLLQDSLSESVYYIVNKYGDTIPTGTPVTISTDTIHLDTIPDIKNISATPPLKIKAHSNIFSDFIVDKKEVASNRIRKKTPGKKGLEQAESGTFNKTVVKASFQKPQRINESRYKDLGTDNFQYLGPSQGLNTSYFSVICEDNKGYLWFGSMGKGIARYDGISITYFTVNEGLVDDLVYDIIVDRNDNLWIATNGGISKYDGIYFTNYTYSSPNQNVFKIHEDYSGMLWFTTQYNGIFQFDPIEETFLNYGKPQGIDVAFCKTIVEDEEHNIWFGGLSGLYKFDGTTFWQYTTQSGLLYDAVIALKVNNTNEIWIGTTKGICKFDGQYFHNFELPLEKSGPYVHYIFQDSQDDLWFCTRWQGLLKFNGTSFTQFKEPEGITGTEALKLMEDRSGNLWMTTYGGGIYRHRPNVFTYLNKASGLSSNKVHSITTDDQLNIWFFAENLTKYDGQYFYVYQQQPFLEHINSIKYGTDGDIWLGGFLGLVKFDGSRFKIYPRSSTIDHSISNMYVSSSETLWLVGEHAGYSKLEGEKLIRFDKAEQILGNMIVNVVQDQQDNMWVGSINGLIKHKEDKFTIYTTNEGLLSNSVSAIHIDRKNQIWIGTQNGLMKFDGKHFKSFSPDVEALRSNILSIAEDKNNNLWVVTGQSLTLIREKEIKTNQNHTWLDDYQVTHFTEKDGLKIFDFLNEEQHVDKNNNLWIGSMNGLTRLNINNYINNRTQQPPLINLKSININNEFVDFSDEDVDKEIRYTNTGSYHNYPINLSTSYRKNHFSFNYIGIDWIAPHKLKYQYQISGIDETWSKETFETKVDYRNLSHGDYTFKVRVKGEANIWSKPFEYNFTIRPPWWLTWWAYILYFLAVCSALYIAFLLIKKRWELKNAYQQKEQEAQRLKELDTFKSRLYTNLTHEFRTPLTVILGMVSQMREAPKKYFNEGTQLIERNGKNLLRLINQLLDLSKLEDNSFQLQLQQGDIISYLCYITESFQTYANGENLSLSFFSNLETLEMDFDVEQTKHIMTNLISNAVKYTSSGGAIRVKVEQQGEQLFIKIEDTGIGIATADLPHIFDRFYQVDVSSTRAGEGTGIGLAHTQELVRLMNGIIQVESVIGKGSVFTLKLPIVIRDELKMMNDQWESVTPPIPVNLINNVQLNNIDSEHKNSTFRPHLLLIEDNADVVAYLKSCLQDQYEIDVAFNGKIGVEKAIDSIPELIISDVMMPEKDGYEVCDILKNDERTSHIPIILLTAKADLPSKIVGLRRGADAYLSKPFDKEELLVRLEMMVAKQQKLATYFSKNGESRVEVETLEEAVKVEHEFIQKIRKIVEIHYSNDQFGLPQLCQKVGMSRSQLYRKMKALIDTSPSDFIRTYRLQQAKHLLETTDLNVSEAAWDTGFTNLTHFAKVFQEEFGMLPSKLKT